MPALGGQANRLTYMGGSSCQTAGWTPDGKIIFANSAEHYYFRFTQLYSVDIDGSIPERLNYGPARMIAFGPHGGVLIGRNTEDPARWKRYRGGRRGLIWIKRSDGEHFQPLIYLEGNMSSPMWITTDKETQGRIYFICDHEGIGNLYSCLPRGDDLCRHSDHETFYARNASTDGKRIVYHAGAELYLFDPSSETTSEITVEFHSPQVQRNRKFVDSGKYLESWELHPSGQAVAISTRGKVFSFANWEGAVMSYEELPSKEKSESISEVSTSVRYRLPRWLNDGKRLVAVTDAGGEESFVILQADGNQPAEILPEMDIGRPGAVSVNPKKDQIIFSNHRYEIIFLDLVSKDLRLIERGKAFPVRGFDWSPDGNWVAYSISISQQISVLKLWNVDSGEITQLTQPVLRDVSPMFDPGGKYLYFLSYRQFDPVHDNVHLDFNFPRGMRPYLITLQEDLPSPFIPESKVDDEIDKDKETKHEAPSDRDTAISAEQIQDRKVAQIDEETDEVPFQIDLEGIEKRVIAFPVVDGRYRSIFGTKDSKVLYSRYPVEGELNQPLLQIEPTANGTLLVYNYETQKEETVIKGITDFKLTPDGTMLIYRAGNYLRVFKAGEKPEEQNNHRPGRKSGWLDLSRVKVSIDPGAEWQQMYREAWRLQRDQFWTPDMSGVDWVEIHDRYLPLVERVSSRSEFSDLMWEMQGELGTSHCYEIGGDYRPAPSYALGLLGAEFSYDPDTNGWRVTNILQGDAWDPDANSPLNNPGVNIKIGDSLTAINGIRLNFKRPPAKCLVNLAGSEVLLTILPAGEEIPRIVTVKTLKSEMKVRYRNWVDGNRRFVHSATDGQVGYIHIPDMSAWGFSEFHRGYLAEIERPGMIVDVRFNRGGYISALLLEKLARRRLGYDKTRWSPIAIPYPEESPSGPMVAIANEFSASDGDIFSHAFKMLGLGPLIGTRTWGGVIGIEPRHWLVDGTITTQPEFSFWFSDVGWGVENYGTDPDIEVDITPEDYARGVDTQLERAIEEILKLLAEHLPEIPAFEERPKLALPKLPKRNNNH
jgi:tricorn protease